MTIIAHLMPFFSVVTVLLPCYSVPRKGRADACLDSGADRTFFKTLELARRFSEGASLAAYNRTGLPLRVEGATGTDTGQLYGSEGVLNTLSETLVSWGRLVQEFGWGSIWDPFLLDGDVMFYRGNAEGDVDVIRIPVTSFCPRLSHELVRELRKPPYGGKRAGRTSLKAALSVSVASPSLGTIGIHSRFFDRLARANPEMITIAAGSSTYDNKTTWFSCLESKPYTDSDVVERWTAHFDSGEEDVAGHRPRQVTFALVTKTGAELDGKEFLEDDSNEHFEFLLKHILSSPEGEDLRIIQLLKDNDALIAHYFDGHWPPLATGLCEFCDRVKLTQPPAKRRDGEFPDKPRLFMDYWGQEMPESMRNCRRCLTVSIALTEQQVIAFTEAGLEEYRSIFLQFPLPSRKSDDYLLAALDVAWDVLGCFLISPSGWDYSCDQEGAFHTPRVLSWVRDKGGSERTPPAGRTAAHAVVERAVRSGEEMTIALILQTNIPEDLWCFAAEYAPLQRLVVRHKLQTSYRGPWLPFGVRGITVLPLHVGKPPEPRSRDIIFLGVLPRSGETIRVGFVDSEGLLRHTTCSYRGCRWTNAHAFQAPVSDFGMRMARKQILSLFNEELRHISRDEKEDICPRCAYDARGARKRGRPPDHTCELADSSSSSSSSSSSEESSDDRSTVGTDDGVSDADSVALERARCYASGSLDYRSVHDCLACGQPYEHFHLPCSSSNHDNICSSCYWTLGVTPRIDAHGIAKHVESLSTASLKSLCRAQNADLASDPTALSFDDARWDWERCGHCREWRQTVNLGNGFCAYGRCFHGHTDVRSLKTHQGDSFEDMVAVAFVTLTIKPKEVRVGPYASLDWKNSDRKACMDLKVRGCFGEFLLTCKAKEIGGSIHIKSHMVRAVRFFELGESYWDPKSRLVGTGTEAFLCTGAGLLSV